MFRTLVDQRRLVPDEAELTIVLCGDLAAILRFAANKKTPTSFRKSGFWVPYFRNNRWLRGRSAYRFSSNQSAAIFAISRLFLSIIIWCVFPLIARSGRSIVVTAPPCLLRAVA